MPNCAPPRPPAHPQWVPFGDRTHLAAETLQTHDDIQAVAVLGDDLLASGHVNGTVLIWDMAARSVRHDLGPLDGAATALAALPGGQLVTGTRAGTLQIWGAQDFREIGRFRIDAGGISAMKAITPGILVFGTTEGVIYRWDIARGAPVAIATTAHMRDDGNGEVSAMHEVMHQVNVLIGLPDNRIAVACEGGTLRIVDLATGALGPLDDMSHETISALVRLDDGRLATADSDGTVRYWRDRVLALSARHDAFHEPVTALAKLADGRLAVGLDRGTIVVLDPARPHEERRLVRHTAKVRAMLPLTDGRLVSASMRTIHIWNVPKPQFADPTSPREAAVVALAALNNDRIACATSDGAITLRTGPGGTVGQLVGQQWRTRATAMAVATGDALLSGDEHGTLHVWIPGQPSRTRRLRLSTSTIRAIAPLIDGRVAVATAADGIRLVDLAQDAQVKASLLCDSDPLALALLAPDLLAAAYEDGTVRVWDLTFRRERHRYALRGRLLAPLAPLPEHGLAIAENDGIILWDWVRGEEIARLRGHTAPIRALAALGPDWLASAAGDNTVRMWNLATRRCIGVHELNAPVGALLHLGDGRLVAGDDEGRVSWILAPSRRLHASRSPAP